MTINPTTEEGLDFMGQFMIVQSIGPRGAHGFFISPAGTRHYHAPWADIEYVGLAAFPVLMGDDDDLTRPADL